MKCEFCKHWNGLEFTAQVDDGTTNGTRRHLQLPTMLHPVIGKCVRFPKTLDVQSDHVCGEFEVLDKVLRTFSSIFPHTVVRCEELSSNLYYVKSKLAGSRKRNMVLRNQVAALKASLEKLTKEKQNEI